MTAQLCNQAGSVEAQVEAEHDQVVAQVSGEVCLGAVAEVQQQQTWVCKIVIKIGIYTF